MRTMVRAANPTKLPLPLGTVGGEGDGVAVIEPNPGGGVHLYGMGLSSTAASLEVRAAVSILEG